MLGVPMMVPAEVLATSHQERMRRYNAYLVHVEVCITDVSSRGTRAISRSPLLLESLCFQEAQLPRLARTCLHA